MSPDLLRGVAEELPEGALARKLALGRPLRVKLGLDPTSPDIHLGHTVVLRKLRAFQDHGHKVVLIVGDYTARVGDPSGRAKARPVVSGDEIDRNARTYQEQAFRILSDDPELVEVRRNSEWLDMPMEALFALVRQTTVAQLLEREDFARRFAAREPIALLELLYPVLQGFDSVAVEADVEIGGTDQKFNLLLGRDVQRAHGQAEQAVMTLPILVGTDGTAKMSKSLGNTIGVTDDSDTIYGRTLSLPDEAIGQWYELLLGRDPAPGRTARDAKRELGRELVDQSCGEGTGAEAEARFDRIFLRREAPEQMPETSYVESLEGTVHLPRVMADAFGLSRSEARRLIGQAGVRIDGEAVTHPDVSATGLDGRVLQAGRRRFVRLRAAD